MKKLFTTAAIALALAAPGFAAAADAAPAAAAPAAAAPTNQEAELANFRAIMAKGLREVYVDQLDLTPEQGAKFWPIYDKYAADMKKQNDDLLGLIKRYAAAYNAGPVDEATAKKLVQDALAQEKAETQLREKAVKDALKVLPAQKAALFAQIDNKVRVTIKYDLASQIPLID
jgi:Spy/CpxP family protein refolding chaperone